MQYWCSIGQVAPADSAQVPANFQEKAEPQNSTCKHACCTTLQVMPLTLCSAKVFRKQTKHDARALCVDANLLHCAVLQCGLLLEQVCHSLQHASQANAFRQVPKCLHAYTGFFWAVSAKLPGYVPMMMTDHSAWLLLLLLSFLLSSSLLSTAVSVQFWLWPLLLRLL